jgi:peptide/nickel transport system substrate-binding protein
MIGRRTLLAAAATPLLPLPAMAEGRLTLAIERDIQGDLDPATRLSAIEANILKAVCPGLIAFRPGSFDWQPALAASITARGDTEIAFTLRPDLQFHDGFGPVTAEDVKFSFERFRQPGPDGALPTYADDWAALDRVEVTGTLAGTIHLRQAAPMLWNSVLPDASGCIISRRALEQGAYRTGHPPVRVIGAGAWRFAGWEPNRQVVLRADPPAAFTEIVLRPVRDRKTAELALRADEIQFSAIDPQNLRAIGAEAHTRTLKQDGINMVWLGMNVERRPLDDIRVRQAIASAIDVDQVVEGAWNGTAARAYAPLAPGLTGFWKDAPKRRRDVDAARRKLAEAGVRDLRLRLTLLNQPEFQSAATIIQALLQDAGIRVDLDVQDGGAFWSAGSGEAGRTLELALQRFAGKADPAFNLQWFTSAQVGRWNWERWRDPEFDRLVQAGGATNDRAQRQRLYEQAQARMDQSAAFVWLTHEVHAFGFRDWLKPAIEPNGDDLLLDRFARA